MSKLTKLLLFITILIFCGIFFGEKSYADTCGCSGDAYYCYSRDVCNAVTSSSCCTGVNDWICGRPEPQFVGGEVYCCTYTVWDDDGCAPTCGTCTPTCPSGSATSPVTSYPVTASCSNGSGCSDSTKTCYYQRQDLCTS